MRRRRSWVAHQAVELNVIPLIDVVFFLLVFYVISTSFTPEATVAVDRPQSTQATTSSTPSLQVVATATGEIVIAGQRVEPTAISQAVAGELARLGISRVVLIADRQVPTGQLLSLMDACTAGGASAVDVAATAGSSP